MIHKYMAPRILFPQSVNEVLDMVDSEENAVFWAGGTRLSDSQISKPLIDLPRVLIVLSGVDELFRASRSSQGLSIGAMMTLDRIASFDPNALPPQIPDAIFSIASRPIRCRASIGGHIVSRNSIGALKPLLHILDTKVELRYRQDQRGRRKAPIAVRTVPVASLNSLQNPLHRGTLLTRIIIPEKYWSFGQYQKIPLLPNERRSLIFCALARIDKGIISEFRMGLCDTAFATIRDAELETSLNGVELPLTSRVLSDLYTSAQRLEKLWSAESGNSFDSEMIITLIQDFFVRASLIR